MSTYKLNTKPLADALNLGVLNANISKLFLKSCLIEITAGPESIRFNIEALNIRTEMIMKGSSTFTQEESVFVDALTLKNLVNSFEANVTTFEFVENGVVVSNGKSRFELPKTLDEATVKLNRPTVNTVDAVASPIEIKKEDWSFINDNQTYALSQSMQYAVYQLAFFGAGQDVLTGDLELSLFTHTKKNTNLPNTCMLSSTIINLIEGLPEGATVQENGKTYLIRAATDGFSYISEISPAYEDDPNVGTYNSQIILEMMRKDTTNAGAVNLDLINKFLKQAALVKSHAGSQDTPVTNWKVADGVLYLSDDSSHVEIEIAGCPVNYEGKFDTTSLTKVLSHLDAAEALVAPLIQDEEVSGIKCWTDNMTVVLAFVG